MGRRSEFRAILVVLIVVAVIAALVVGGRVAFEVTQRRETSTAFTVLNKVADRIDLQSVIPNATPIKSGVAVRLGGSGEGPSVTYRFNADDAPHWDTRLNAAMKKAGYGIGNGGAGAGGWAFYVGDYDVTVSTSLPGESDGFVNLTAN